MDPEQGNDTQVNPVTGHQTIIQEFPTASQAHSFNDVIDNYAGYATQTSLDNATLYPLKGSLNGATGKFEWIIQDGQITHRIFVQN